MKPPNMILTAATLATLVLAGCESDERVVQVATQAADRQAGQNEELARLNREVAEGTKRLVEADAKARQELVAMQRELEQQQAELGRRRDQLETERRAMANQRHRDPIIAGAITTVGLILACLVPLLLCWRILKTVRDEPTDALVGEVLIEELASERPTLLPPALCSRDDPTESTAAGRLLANENDSGGAD